MIAFLKSQWKGMAALAAILLVALNLWVLVWGSAQIVRYVAEGHAVFEQMKALVEQQQKALAEKKP